MTASRYWKGVEGPPASGARRLMPFARTLVNGLWSVRVHHADRVPRTGPVILAANHTGLLDGPLVYGVSARPVHALVKRELFSGVLGRALRALGQIELDRFQVDRTALEAALAVLERGDVLAIYPEGTRGSGDFARIKPGVAYLGLCTGAPVVPVALLGIRRPGRSVESLPRLRARLDVVFGEPIAIEPRGWPRTKDLVRREADRLRGLLARNLDHALESTGRTQP